MQNIKGVGEANSKKLLVKPQRNANKDFFSAITMINNFEINNKIYQNNIINIINIDNKNKLKTDASELNFNYYKEHFMNNAKEHNSMLKEQNETKKNNVDFSSEIIKFKTELCHSWELTGTCKYGVNVSLYCLILIISKLVCICSW